MLLCWSSASYWPQTKVTLFVKSISLVLVHGLFLGLDTVPVHSSPVQVHRNTQQLHYCDYTITGKLYEIVDLLKCMNELASMKNGKRQERSTNEGIQFFPNSMQSKQYSQHSTYPQSLDNNAPMNLHRGPSYPANNPGYYKYPPALPPGYPLTSDSSFTPGILGINLVDALSSISHYDDLKCVPRIICEVAAGVIPGNSVYKQNNANTGMNALISLLTAVNSGDTSPLLNFGKSALMGYANRGNSEICYRQYSKCPRNPNEVVNYLNNHNGGFFRFFNRNSGLGYRVDGNHKASSSSQNFVSDRKGTGELKFDTATPITRSKISNYHGNKDDSKSIIFPDEQRHFNRLIKSFDYEYENRDVIQEKPKFFHQDRMDQNIADQLYYLRQKHSHNEQQNLYNESEMLGAKLYLLDNAPSENHRRFVFPDGQSVMIDIGFSKLFNEEYKNMLNRGLIINDIPQSINFEGLSVINLPELYTQDYTQQYIQVIHPCDMICHDSRGTAIQFNQMVDSRGILSTIMIPERPVVDLSQSLPCTIICLNRDGERQQMSTTLSKVLRANHHGKHEVDRSTIRFKRAPSRNRIIKPRFVGDTLMRSVAKPSNGRSSFQMPQFAPSNNQPFGLPIGTGADWPSGLIPNENPWLNQYPIRETPSISSQEDDEHLLDNVAVGENPLAFAITVEPQPKDLPTITSESKSLPSTMIMCGGFIFFIPASAQGMPMCGASLETHKDQEPRRILYQPRNIWGNYTNFFAHYANIGENGTAMNVTDSTKPIEQTTTEMGQHLPEATMPPIIVYPTDQLTTIDQPIATVPPTPTFPPIGIAPPALIPADLFPVPDPSDIFDYQEATSCLEGESWDTLDQHCVPIKYHKDAEYEYPEIPGYNWEKIPVRKRDGGIQKIVIKTPEADMYIER